MAPPKARTEGEVSKGPVACLWRLDLWDHPPCIEQLGEAGEGMASFPPTLPTLWGGLENCLSQTVEGALGVDTGHPLLLAVAARSSTSRTEWEQDDYCSFRLALPC